MSIVAIVSGLLLWLSLPAFFSPRAKEWGGGVLVMVCRIAGIALIAFGILKGLL